MDLAIKQNIAVEKVTLEQLEEQVTGNHQGICALCKAGEVRDEKWLHRLVESLMESDSDHKPFILILDGITDPHNLGACLRTADAAGVDAIIIPKDNSASLTAVAQKVASGAAESVPLIAVTNLARCMAELQQLGVWITGASDQAEVSIFNFKYFNTLIICLL